MVYFENPENNDFERLSVLLSNFNGDKLDKGSRLMNLRTPIFNKLCDFLEFVIAKKHEIQLLQPDNSSKITFIVKATYDKPFYCAAKLADKAISITENRGELEYYVSFFQYQLYEIEMMHYALVCPDNSDRSDLQLARKILNKYSYEWFLCSHIEKFLDQIKSDYGWQPFLSSSFLVDILRKNRKETQRKYDYIYSEIAKENRIISKWKNEYYLFVIVSSFVKDAIYQYRADWLGQQSFDIFIPSQNIAIEYQGKQHFEPVKMFGGEKSFEETINRDNRKRELSAQNGVTVFDWEYTLPINRENVLLFLSKNGIKHSKISLHFSDQPHSQNIIAPIIQKVAKEKITKEPDYYIVQYSLQGDYIQKFKNIREGATLTGTGYSSIVKVLKGERNSAGNYVWRKFSADNIPLKIEIKFDISKINDGR